MNDAISGAFFIAFAGLIFFLTREFRLMPGQNYGASFFPRTIASCMALVGLVLVFQGIRSRGSEPWATAFDWVSSPRHVANFALVIVALVFYILAAETLGFLIAGFITLYGLLFWLRGAKHWLTSLTISLVGVVVLQLFFGKFLRVPLPWGLLQSYAF